jgi:uncharacterized protein (TIGR02145 family)
MKKFPVITIILAILMIAGTLVFKKGVLNDSASSKYTNGQATMTDPRDGQSYRIVKIGNQIWMAENLNFEVPNSYCYKNSADSCAKYGRLYIWSAAMDSAGMFSPYGIDCGMGKPCSPQYPVQGVCPKGWHLPTITEWEILLTEVGGVQIEKEHKNAYKTISAGIALKSTSGWDNNDNGSDLYSFSTLPSGIRRIDKKKGKISYRGVKSFANFWSSIENEKYHYAAFINFYTGATVNFIYGQKDAFANSVRCLKD